MTEIYIDSANINEIKTVFDLNIIKGVTTNQKIFLKEKGCNFEEQSKKILKMVDPYPVSLEGPNDASDILIVADKYNSWNDNVVIKVPMLPRLDSLLVIQELSKKGIMTNATACMDLNQVYLASESGANYVSLFYCRMRDAWGDEYARYTINKAMELLEESKTKLIIGSVREPNDVNVLLGLQPDIITVPYKILSNMCTNKVTEKVLQDFDKAWREFKKYEKV